MSTALKRNSDFQATSLDWLGEFPSHWQVEPGLAVLKERQVKNIGLVEPTVLSLSYGRVVIKPQDKLRGLVPESFETYQIVEPGNIIIRPTDLQNDHVSLRVGQAKDRGIITSAYMCLETKGKLTEDFAHLLLHAYDIKKVFYGLGSGLRQNLSWVDFRRLPIPVPPTEEQAQIVRFIRHLDQRVNRLIKTKRRLIELLNEQKQAIIHRTVTRGLDPTVPLKPSGIEWLGDVPSHWEVLPLGQILKERKEKNNPIKTTDILSLGLSTGVIPYGEKTGGGNKAKEDLSAYMLAYPGDIVVNSMNVVVGSVGLSKYFGAVSPVYYMLRPRYEKDKVEFYDAVFHSPVFQMSLFGLGNGIMFIESKSSGKLNTIRLRIPMRKLNRVVLPYPPPEEQERIVEYLDDSTRDINLAISKTQSEIDLIREYRTRLVADVVTGQLDVRHLDLPEVEESLIEAIDAGSDPELDEDTEEAVDAD